MGDSQFIALLADFKGFRGFFPVGDVNDRAVQDAAAVIVGDKTSFIECVNKQLEELKNRQCIYKDEAARIKEELTVLQLACPHEDTTFDHKDYHKNEDYYKCNTCGMIV